MKRTAHLDAQQLALSFDGPAVPPPASAPLGDRRLLIGHEAVHYTLRRARRRSIGFTIDDRGLTVAAPRWVTLREIEAAITEKQRWIHSKLHEWRDWRSRQPVPVMYFADGGVLLFLGRSVILRLRPEAESARLVETTATPELHLALPLNAAEQRVRDALQSWLKAQARSVIGERIERLAARLPTKPRTWSLSSARSQWGSCTHDRHVRLNWRLVHFSLPVIDYVVAHELAHLKEMNHSPRFWQSVGELLPGFETERDQIREVDLSTMPL